MDEHFRFMVENAKELSRIYPAQISNKEFELDHRFLLNYAKQNLADIVLEYDTLHRWLATFPVHVHPHIDELPYGPQYSQLVREPRLQKVLSQRRGEGRSLEP
jgi:hypothetical protein